MNVENHNDCVVMYNDDRPIPTLPNELTALVFESLEQSIKIKIARVSKVWNAFIYSPIFWKKVILYDASKFQTGTFERLKLVEELDARGSNLTDAFIKTLVTGSAGTTLKVLDISVNKITNVSILFIGLHCCNLMKIFIEGCPEVTDIRPLKLLVNNLSVIITSYCEDISDASIFQLSSAFSKSHLTKLDLDGCILISNDGIKEISKHLNKLKYLVIDGKGIVDESIVSIFKNCNELALFSMSFCELLTDITLYEILNNLNSNLLFLRLRKGINFTKYGFNDFFKGLMIRRHSFRSLDFSECQNISDLSLNFFSQPFLKWLSLDWCWDITESSILKIIEASPNLEELMLTGCNISCESLTEKEFKNLKILNLWSCRNVEPEIIKTICKNNKSLYIVDYYGEVNKEGKKIGDKDNIFIIDEKLELMIGGRERRWGLL
ncbi:2595_t:CDS:2, partial [Entrophospora sp. SA101]